MYHNGGFYIWMKALMTAWQLGTSHQPNAGKIWIPISHTDPGRLFSTLYFWFILKNGPKSRSLSYTLTFSKCFKEKQLNISLFVFRLQQITRPSQEDKSDDKNEEDKSEKSEKKEDEEKKDEEEKDEKEDSRWVMNSCFSWCLFTLSDPAGITTFFLVPVFGLLNCDYFRERVS